MPISPRTPPHLVTLVLLTALSALTLNTIVPSLPAIARELGARDAAVALVVSGYMLASAVFQLGLGPLSDRFGRRPVMLGAVALFTLASIGCMLARDVTVLVACRVLQAAIVAGTVVSSAAIRDQYSAVDSAAKLSLISSAMAVAPMLGPLAGGLLDQTFGWRSVFALYAAFGVALLLLAAADMGETRRPGLAPPRLADGAVLLRSALYGAYVLCAAFSVGAFFIFVTGVPYVAAPMWGLSSAQVGAGIGSITAGFMAGAAISAWANRRAGTRLLLMAGRWVSIAALGIGLALTAMGLQHPLALFGFTVFVGLGNGLTLPNANAGALSVRPALAGTAAGLSGAISVALGAVLSGLTAMAVERDARPFTLLALMLGSVLLSWIAALAALRLQQREGGMAP